MRETLVDGGPGGGPLGSPELRAALDVPWVAEPERYYDILADSAADIDIWETTYLHVLDGDDPVVEWVKGTGLRPVLSGLDDSERATFLREYARRLREAYPRRGDGRTVFPFRRVFVVATPR